MSRSRYRGSPTRSPYRSPARLYETERDAIIEDEIRLKSALRVEADARRVTDQISLLQTKLRVIPDLEARVESLLRQNNQLARDNDELAREVSQRRYEVQRLRIATAEQHDRDALKTGQLFQANKSLQLELQLQKKERIEGNRLYESHIQKLQRMLDDKVQELDITNLRCSDLSKELELTMIQFEEEKNRLKNLMARTEHELERELEYTKEKQTTEKFSEIDAMKRNYSAQVALLEDQIAKLKLLNQAKSEEFESQLNENKNLRRRHDEEVRALGAENDDLRGRMLKLEQINRSEVENIQVKYNDYHNQGTSNLKEQHGRQIKLLLDEIDKLKWLTQEKNTEIQNLVQEKRELRRNMDESQLELGSEIETLKNKLYTQSEKNASDSHALMARINDLCDKSLRESEAYHTRAKEFKRKISSLESEVNDKQNIIDKNTREAEGREKELIRSLNESNASIENLKRELNDSEEERKSSEKRFKEYKARSESEIARISKELNETAVKLEETQDNLARQIDDKSGSEELLNVEIQSLRKTIQILEGKLSSEQKRHSQEMNEFSNNLNDKVKRLQTAQRKALDELEASRHEQIDNLNSRLEKANRDREYAERELEKYIKMYDDLEKYFKDPSDGALFEERSKNSIYQVLSRLSQSSVHIF